MIYRLLQRLHRIKTLLLALLVTTIGFAFLVLANWIDASAAAQSFRLWPISELGSTLFVTGALVIAWEYLDAKDRERRDDERVRRLLRESAPDFRDAVVQGFAVSSDDLKRVATPELLDAIAKNVLALRLGDRQFAEELYEEFRDQAIRAPERWYDVDVSIRLSHAARWSSPDPLRFDVLVQWEYTVTPTHPVQRFACVSDRDEFHELLSDVPVTSTWFMTPRRGFEANKRDAFELLSFTVNGEPRKIRRTIRKTGQTYSATIGEDLVRAAKPVRIKHVYRTITPQSGHRLFVELAQPTKGLSLDLDYSDTSISHLSVTELVSSAQRTQVSRLPDQVNARVISVDLPGWLLPRDGFAFVWTLASEEGPSARAGSARSHVPTDAAA